MAIVFTKNLSTSVIQNAFNNNIVEFASNVPTQSQKCEVEVTHGSDVFTFVITPDTNNDFYFNFKEIASKIARENNFKDSLTTIDIGLIPYDLYFSISVNYTITFTAGGKETTVQNYNFYKSVMQINNPIPNVFATADEFDILNYSDLTVFNGYPFDVSVYLLNDATITNTVTNESVELTRVESENRLFLSDGYFIGDEDASFFRRVNALSGGFTVNNPCAYVLPTKLLDTGLNRLKIAENGNLIDFNVTVKDGCGVYLKYFNNYGNYSYWLFEDVYKADLRYSNRDTINVDFLDIDETFATELTTGKDAEKSIVLQTKKLDRNQRKQLESLFVSPRVEMFLGTKGEFVTDYSDKWQTVILSNGTFTTENTKRELSNATVTINMKYFTS